VEPDDKIDRLTRSVSDGAPVDWERVGADPDLDSDTVEAMRDVARIAEFNRDLQRTSTDPTTGEPPAAAPVAPPLERWRDLTLLEAIGAGARGQVWRAWDVTLQRQVALKFLVPSDESRGANASADLLSEARALARVRHPNIVTVFGIAEDQGRVGMWMECVPGITLRHEIERVGALPAHRVARIGLQLCSALEALDAAGLVHRDIKPANILLEGEDRAVLTDFGLGWRPELGDDLAPRASGTPLFMAPEVLAGGTPTHQGDLYSLGVTLWWALAGRLPFEARTMDELRNQVARGPSRSLPEICPRAPRGLIDAILAAMKPAPSERIRSAVELTARLRPFAAGASDTGPHPSIAVLAFANHGPGDEDAYFADGLADELIGMLAKIRGLRVAARTSAFTFRGKGATIGEIGQALRVDSVLDGSVRRSGDRIRISVQLIKVSDGLHLWSETYDRRLDNIFAVQDDIARSVVQELRTALMGREADVDLVRAVGAEVAQAARGRAADPRAHRLYLLGRYFMNLLSREDLTRAIQYLTEAVALDPEFARAWAELGAAYQRAATWGLMPRAEAIEKARDAAARGLAIEPDLSEAHARLGSIQKYYDWDWKAAEASLTRALELAPGDSAVLNSAGVLATVLGRVEESIQLHRRASEQDPLSASPHTNLALTFLRSGRFVEAEEELRRALDLAPQRLLTHSALAEALVGQGRGDEALAEAMREPDEGQRWYALAIVHHTLGHRSESDAALRQLVEAHGRDYAFQVAEIHGLRGEIDASFEWLERAYAERDFGLTELRSNRSFRALHGDPRWRALMVKMGFDEGAT
jgi:serine/threonine protein kinase/Tfp pilus assembly protein PilF